MPIGMKNPTSGSLRIALNSVMAGQSPNYLALQNTQVKTSGNPYVHLVLRGGKGQSNVTELKLRKLLAYLDGKNIQNVGFVVDASHENSIDETGKKNPYRQPNVVFETLRLSEEIDELKPLLKGWMMESFLEDGRQDVSSCNSASDLVYGKSVTDACLGWNETEKFILDLNKKLDD